MRGLTGPIQVLDRRLAARSAAPLTVAFSGGGDSLALLLTVVDWAKARGRAVRVLTVDHQINPDSHAWTRACARMAERLGLTFEALHWNGEKPATGLQAAARTARHALLADAARAAGARVLLMGHTADDRLEAAAMRTDGSTVPSPREWAPSPAWPEGRGLFLLRPLLACRRAELRTWLAAQGETWIDDPANSDPRYTRSRTRDTLAGAASVPDLEEAAETPTKLTSATIASAGLLALPRTAPTRALAIAALCAGGTSRPPRGDRLANLAGRLAREETFTTTLGGARIEAKASEILFMRNADETRQGGLPAMSLSPGEPTTWDGRFELTAATEGLHVQSLAGLIGRLSRPARAALSDLPPAARRGLPAVLDPEGRVTCPVLAEPQAVHVTALAVSRFEAAIGGLIREPTV